MSLLDRIKVCNNGTDVSDYSPFFVDGQRLGWIHRDFAPALIQFGDVFQASANAVALNNCLNDYQSRSAAVVPVLRALDAEGWFSGWRDEAYPVGAGFYDEPFFEMERTAVPRFGVAAFGVHVNGFVRDGDELLLWIARRADDKPTYPGMLDNMVAGGQPVGLGLLENVIKEAAEEAAVPAEIAAQAKPVGAISYQHQDDNCLKPDTMFVFDMELPKEFVPKNTDGELSGFQLLPVREVMEITADTAEFKFNCAAVNIDFFIRHGILGPENPDYIDIQRGLHQ
jgi:isopentenyldiphosphate isomerase